MSRLVKPRMISGRGKAAAQGPRDPDSDYTTRLLKYLPAEVVVFYLAATSILNGVENTDPLKRPVGWALVGIGCVASPVSLFLLGKPRGSAWVNVAIATVSFPIWAFALGGPFATLPWYEPWLGGMLILVFTFAVGLYRPTEPGPAPAPLPPS